MFRKNAVSKVFAGMVIFFMLVVLCGNIYSLADENGETLTIQATSGENVTNDANSTSGNETGNKVSNNAVTNNSVSVYNNTVKNTTTQKSKLPYTGSSSKVIFIIVALLGSTLYAYKKVSDYNM